MSQILFYSVSRRPFPFLWRSLTLIYPTKTLTKESCSSSFVARKKNVFNMKQISFLRRRPWKTNPFQSFTFLCVLSKWNLARAATFIVFLRTKLILSSKNSKWKQNRFSTNSELCSWKLSDWIEENQCKPLLKFFSRTSFSHRFWLYVTYLIDGHCHRLSFRRFGLTIDWFRWEPEELFFIIQVRNSKLFYRNDSIFRYLFLDNICAKTIANLTLNNLQRRWPTLFSSSKRSLWLIRLILCYVTLRIVQYISDPTLQNLPTVNITSIGAFIHFLNINNCNHSQMMPDEVRYKLRTHE